MPADTALIGQQRCGLGQQHAQTDSEHGNRMRLRQRGWLALEIHNAAIPIGGETDGLAIQVTIMRLAGPFDLMFVH
jgi:hypothetical protein